MFSLYHNKDTCELRIEPVKNLMLRKDEDYSEITFYNSNYYICKDREQLKDKATQMLKEWKQYHIDELAKLEGVKIKNKYK